MAVIVTLAAAVAVLSICRAYMLWSWCFSEKQDIAKKGGVNND